MTESEASGILLIRSVEECDKNAFPSDTLTDALREAGDPNDEASWFTRRTAYLLKCLSAPHCSILRITKASDHWNSIVWTFVLILGLASNYLGPTAKIHVIFNPILILVVWNLLVYTFLGMQGVRWWYRRTHVLSNETPNPASESADPPAQTTAPSEKPSVKYSVLQTLFLKKVFPKVWTRWQKWTDWYEKAQDAKIRVSKLGEIAMDFWNHWLPVSRSLMASRSRRLLHWSAIGVTIGAILGMYVRGLFFEYNVVWRSTFIRDEGSVSVLLQLLLGPAMMLSGRSFTDDLDVARLMSPDGAPAASWIHLYAVTAFAFILIPRTALALRESIRLRRLANRVQLDFDDEYFRSIIGPARKLQVQQILEQIQTAVRIECAKFSEAVATFVCEKLYDGRIVPELYDFRSNGGRITDLEDQIRRACEAFTPELKPYVEAEQENFERSLSATIERMVGENLVVPMSPDRELDSVVGGASENVTDRLSGSLGHGLTNMISLAVSAAVVLAVGTVSGGFGEAVGVAIVTALLSTTGPIGFLIGALVGLLVAATGWWLGREKLTDTVKSMRLPGAVVKRVLWTKRLQRLIGDGRVHCHTSVKERINGELEPLEPKITNQIWEGIKPFLRGAQES